MANTLFIEIDWDNDGTFTDETANTKNGLIRRGRDRSVGGDQSYEYVRVGECELVMHNSDGRFDPGNTSGALYGYILPNRHARVRITNGTNTYYLFTGRLADQRPQKKDKISRLRCMDGIEYLQKMNCTNVATVQTDYAVSQAITDLLDEAAWPYMDTSGWQFSTQLGIDSYLGSTLLENNGDTIPYWWHDHRQSTWAAIKEISEAFAGDPFVANDGTFAYNARGKFGPSRYTLTEADVMYDADLFRPWDEVRNSIKVVAQPRGVTSTVEIYRMYDTPAIQPGATLTIWAEYQYNGEFAPRSSVVTPVENTDYEANTAADGTGTDKSAQISIVMTDYATEAKLEITNNDAGVVYLTLMALRGVLYTGLNRSSFISANSTSITDYSKRSMFIENRWIQTVQDAIDHAGYTKTRFCNPRDILWLKINNNFDKQFSPDLFDRITIDLSSQGISNEYHITYIEHDIKNLLDITTMFRLEPIQDDYWTFTTALGETSLLGW